jgi:hypothetical protein
MEILQILVEKLSNSMRIYAENSANFHRLRNIDEEEAINNLDRAFEAKLEAFHSLYDISKGYINYFDFVDTTLLIVLRNAIHHRDHLLFKSWNSEMHLNGGMKKMSGAAFLLGNHEIPNALKPSEYYYKLDDILDRLDESRGSPYIERIMSKVNRAKALQLILRDLGLDSCIKKSEDDGYPLHQIYVNIIPIYVSAIKRVFGTIDGMDFNFKGFDSGVYLKHFTGLPNIDMKYLKYKELRLP